MFSLSLVEHCVHGIYAMLRIAPVAALYLSSYRECYLFYILSTSSLFFLPTHFKQRLPVRTISESVDSAGNN